MTRLLSGIVPLLVFCSAYAMDAKAPPIPADPDIIGIVIFAKAFFACIAQF